ncbi:hypothetical protein AB7M16_003284 [Bradyrhizobium sp. USDA 372]
MDGVTAEVVGIITVGAEAVDTTTGGGTTITGERTSLSGRSAAVEVQKCLRAGH